MPQFAILGRKIDYLEGGAQLEIANHVFGALNWSSRVVLLEVDYCRSERDYFICGASALVRVSLKNGALHEDVGYGTSKDRDQGAALERAKKAAVTDARKRALRCFGELLGNSLKHKDSGGLEILNDQGVSPVKGGSSRGPAQSSSARTVQVSGAPPVRRPLAQPVAQPPAPLHASHGPVQSGTVTNGAASHVGPPPSAATSSTVNPDGAHSGAAPFGAAPRALPQAGMAPHGAVPHVVVPPQQSVPPASWSVGGRQPLPTPGAPLPTGERQIAPPQKPPPLNVLAPHQQQQQQQQPLHESPPDASFEYSLYSNIGGTHQAW